MDQPYKYTPLPPGTDQIRLLTLLPASDENEEISVSLQNIETKEAERQYETLSYVWGSQDNPETISVATQERRHSLTDWWRKRRWRKSKGSPTDTSPGAGSKEDDTSLPEHNGAPFPVTKNLAVALRHLRLRDAPRTLWIDAICIDQKNIPEKSEQVAKMARIYSSSKRVVIWLGPASPDSDLAMGHVDHLGKMMRFDGIRLKLTPEGEAEPHWADFTLPLPYEEADLRALEGLFWRPYFERLWVIQEARLNPETAAVCGGQETTWQSVMIACSWLAGKFGQPKTDLRDDFVNRIQRIRLVLEETLYDGASLEDLARSTRGLKCADDRDRIYALLSLARYGDRIKPDYSLTTVEVFRKIPELSIERGDARFLIHCELRSRRLEGPTWIPDWTAKGMTARFSWFNAASSAWQSSARVYPEEGRLRATAVRVGTVADVDVLHVPPMSYTPSLVQREIARIVPADAESSTYKTGCSLLEAFSGTLTANGFTPMPPRNDGTRARQYCMDSVRACLRAGDNAASELDPELDKYLGSAWPTMRGRSLLRTEEGYIGLGPMNMKVGDIVVAFLSCTAFTVVRPSPERENRYTVVGEAFVYGLTNGEAVLGPLPEHFRAEYHLNPDSDGFFNAYRDTRTDDVSKRDPRLDVLGIPFETWPNGSPRRVSTHQLLDAGVAVEQFNLI